MKFRSDRRRFPRYATPPMFHSISVRLLGADQRYDRQGHAYNISMNGVLFELDTPVPPGAEMSMIFDLPDGAQIRVTGRLVRLCDVDEPGPCRMAMAFTGFSRPADRERLNRYLHGAALRKCA